MVSDDFSGHKNFSNILEVNNEGTLSVEVVSRIPDGGIDKGLGWRPSAKNSTGVHSTPQ